ncbi:hypothetical protein HanIR_Chr05g0225191 [Helianthus annuus]|nr:hypothetical protein HanIR_Chr05g0225191 [Helianthus annuus]
MMVINHIIVITRALMIVGDTCQCHHMVITIGCILIFVHGWQYLLKYMSKILLIFYIRIPWLRNEEILVNNRITNFPPRRQSWKLCWNSALLPPLHSMKQTVSIPAAVLEAPEVLDLEDQERVGTL